MTRFERLQWVRSRPNIGSLHCKVQLEIGVQEAHKRRPDLSDDALLSLAEEVHRLSGDGVTRFAFRPTFGHSGIPRRNHRAAHGTLLGFTKLRGMDHDDE